MGITQQRLIKQINASRDCLQALEELMRRIKVQLSENPTSFPLQILAEIKPPDLLNNPSTLIDIAVESENIRLTRAHNDQRRALARKRQIEGKPEPAPTPEAPPTMDDIWSDDHLSSATDRLTDYLDPSKARE